MSFASICAFVSSHSMIRTDDTVAMNSSVHASVHLFVVSYPNFLGLYREVNSELPSSGNCAIAND